MEGLDLAGNSSDAAVAACWDSMKMGMNGVAMTPHGLILSQDGATASRMLFEVLRGPFYLIVGLKINNLTTGPKKY